MIFRTWRFIFLILLMLFACVPLAEKSGVILSNGTQVPMPSAVGMDSDEKGQIQPAAAEGEKNAEPGLPASITMSLYEDPVYRFSIEYPVAFLFRRVSEDRLKGLNPRPVAAFVILRPDMVNAVEEGVESADLEIHIFPLGDSLSLESWLKSNGVLESSFVRRRVGSGLEICASTLIAPGCSYFFLGQGWVYRLTPATLEGENLVSTFRILP